MLGSPPLARKRSRSDLAVAIGAAAVPVAAAVLLPGSLAPVTLLVAFAAGCALERHRQARRERPLGLGETPRLWANTMRDTIGLPAAFAATAAAAAAGVVLAIPSLSVMDGPSRTTAPHLNGPAARPSLPSVRTVRSLVGRPFETAGARYLVERQPHDAARLALSGVRDRRGERWVFVNVKGTNLSRSRFNPNHLSYRLHDSRGRSYAPDLAGGTGPASLGRTGFLPRGQTSQFRLGFRAPRAARRLVLVFEPTPSGTIQARVPLTKESQALRPKPTCRVGPHVSSHTAAMCHSCASGESGPSSRRRSAHCTAR